MRYSTQMKTTLLLIIIFCFSLLTKAQTNGYTSFQLLNLSFNARSIALGGDFITAYDNDINLGIANPSLLNEKHQKTLTFSNSILAGGINSGMLGYGFKLKEIATLAVHMKYVSYGKITRTNINGTENGSFTPFEMILGGSIGREINEKLSIGATYNFLFSQIETYNSIGSSIDFSGTYRDEENGFLVTLLAKNIGYQFKGYIAKKRALLPVNIMLGLSYKIKHAPFRFSILGHNLQKWKIAYDDPKATETTDPLTDVIILPNRPGFFEHLAQHFTYQAEVFIGKKIHARLGFNYYQRKNLALEQRPGLAGLSCGVGVNFRKIRFDYGFVIHSRAGFSNMLTLSADLSTWKK